MKRKRASYNPVVEEQREEFFAKRLIDWMVSSPRKPANQAFTAGPLRQVAYAIEGLTKTGERV